jgi:serine/threonine protein kinase
VTDLRPGDVFAGIRIDAVAGRGGMGVVYAGTHLALNRRVALKLIAPGYAQTPEFRERFKRESRTAASIDHPNVIPIYDAGEEGGQLYVTMRLASGTDLGELIKTSGRLDSLLAGNLIAQVGAALDAAHREGLVHRDVKPANALIEFRDGHAHAYLTDFGLTKHAASESALTSTGVVVGTVDYMAPEQIEGKPADARSDVYALGCVLYHAVCGCVPFLRDSPMAVMYAHTRTPPPPLRTVVRDVAPALEEVIARAMAKDPADRYPSAGDLGRAALAAAAGQPLPTSERSVATGDAVHSVTSAPTRPRPHETVREPSPAVPVPSPIERVPEAAPTAVLRKRSLAVPVLAVLAILSVGVAAGVLVTTGALSGSSEDAAESTPVAAARDEDPSNRSDAERAPAASPGDGQTPESRTPTTVAPPAERLHYTPYVSVGGGFEAELPAASEWSDPSESRPNGEIHRTRMTGPGGLGLLIDVTPNLRATYADESRCRGVEYPQFPLAQECVFQGGSLPECQRARCIDILLNESESGPGYGVLVGGGDFATAETVARHVAGTLVPRG